MKEYKYILREIIANSMVFNWKYPEPCIVELSISDFCNRKCTMCPKSLDNFPNPKHFMSLETAERIAWQLEEIKFIGLIILAGFGEPTAHPRLKEIVRILSTHAPVDLVTNADYLSPSKIDELSEHGLNRLLISAYDQKGLKRGHSLIRDRDPDLFCVRDRLFMNYKTNRVALEPKFAFNPKEQPCYYPLYSTLIDYDGGVYPCPQDFTKKLLMGNIYVESLHDIWLNNHYMILRMELMRGREKTPCVGCDVNGTLQGEGRLKLWQQSD